MVMKQRAPQNRIELLQGTLDLLILQTLQWGPQHGYGISQAIRANSMDAFQVDTGSLYPALHRLAKQKLIAAAWKTSENRQRIRVYRLTKKGRDELASGRSRWERFVAAMGGILSPQRAASHEVLAAPPRRRRRGDSRAHRDGGAGPHGTGRVTRPGRSRGSPRVRRRRGREGGHQGHGRTRLAHPPRTGSPLRRTLAAPESRFHGGCRPRSRSASAPPPRSSRSSTPCGCDAAGRAAVGARPRPHRQHGWRPRQPHISLRSAQLPGLRADPPPAARIHRRRRLEQHLVQPRGRRRDASRAWPVRLGHLLQRARHRAGGRTAHRGRRRQAGLRAAGRAQPRVLDERDGRRPARDRTNAHAGLAPGRGDRRHAAGFSGLEVGRGFDVAVPLCVEAAINGGNRLVSATDWWLVAIGRLKPGWTLERATAQLQAISPGIFETTITPTYPAPARRATRRSRSRPRRATRVSRCCARHASIRSGCCSRRRASSC